MYGTELRQARHLLREQLKNDYLGTARQAGYYDAAEAVSLTGPCATGGYNTIRSGLLIAYAWLRLGLPIEQVVAAYRVDPDQLANLSLGTFILLPTLRQEIEDMVVKQLPETPEPQRYVTAYPKVGTLDTDNGTGRPNPVTSSPMGSTHFAR
jgi:hypothetical protein